MKIATWNVNSIKVRLPIVTEWLQTHAPDVLMLQEIKTPEFPSHEFEKLGYRAAFVGQKSYNGVATLTKNVGTDPVKALAGDAADEHARFLGLTVDGVRVINIYLPNGNPIGTEKFAYKLAWMKRLQARAAALLAEEMPLILAGDFNVIPEPEDAKRPQAWVDDALFQPESRAAWRTLVNLGFTDATRACHPGPGIYTFWDYQAGAFQKDDGIRIDHILLSSQAADLLRSSGIDRETRAQEKPSDHVPVWIKLAA